MTIQNAIKSFSFQTICGQSLTPRIVGDKVILDDSKTGEMFDWMNTDDFAYVVDTATVEDSGKTLTINW